ncbi:hypothetical protein ACC674_37680, partial [Rhizobium ruizarguesonis]
DNFGGKVDTVMRGAAYTLSFGLADELTAQMRSNPLAVQKKPEGYYDKGIFAGDYNPLGGLSGGCAIGDADGMPTDGFALAKSTPGNAVPPVSR